MTDARSPDDREALAARFGAIMLGHELVDEPPAPGSPLERLQELVRQRDAGHLEQANFEEAVRRLHQDD